MSNYPQWSAGKIAGVFLAAFAFLFPILGCSHHESEMGNGPASAPQVVVMKPAWITFDHKIEQPGWIQALYHAPLYAKIKGYVETVNVEVGSRVKKGDVLAVLRVPEMDEELKRKTALVVQAQIEIGQSEISQRVAQANLQTSKSLVKESQAALKQAEATCERWKSESLRFDKLFADNALDKQSAEETRKQYQSAQAGVELASAKIQSAEAIQAESEAKRDKAKADLGASRNRLVIAEADCRHTAEILQYTRIVAPFDGIVSERLVDPGHLMQSGDSARSNPLFVCVSMDTVRVFLDVPEADAVYVQEGAPAVICIQALKEKEFKGKVAGTSGALDKKQRTMRVEIDFPNPTGELRPGMYAYASITSKSFKSLAIPTAAIDSRDGVSYCFMVESGLAVRTPIKIGARQAGMVELVKKQIKNQGATRWENISSEDLVIVPYPSQITDRQPVVSLFREGAK
jgi:multidrug efflux pump subunit AcrA (membrane-fusion protein)